MVKQDPKYLLSSRSVLFHPQIDKINNYQTLAFNSKKGKYLKINSFGYAILKIIDESTGISSIEIAGLLAQDIAKIEKFVNLMIKENVILEK